MRNRSSRSGRVAAVGAVLAVALGTGTGGNAAAAEDAVAVPCPLGFVCLSAGPNGTGATYRITQGAAVHFGSAPLVGEATNHTNIDYCVSGSLSYLLRSGETRTQDSFVRSVVPRPTSGTCPV